MKMTQKPGIGGLGLVRENSIQQSSIKPKDTPKDYSDLQILDTLDDFKGSTMPRDFMASLDGSLERMLQASGKAKTFLRKGHGHVNRKIHNWDRTSVSSFSMSKSSSSKKFGDTDRDYKSTFQSPPIRFSKAEICDRSPSEDIIKTQKGMSNFLNSQTAEKSAQDIAHRICSLKERYSKPSECLKKPVLTTRHRIANNEDLKNVSQEKRPIKTHTTSLSSSHKLLIIKEEQQQASKVGIQIHGIKVTKPIKKRHFSNTNATVGVMSCLKATANTNKQQLPPKEDLTKIKNQVDGQEKLIAKLKEEIDRRDHEMKAA